LGTVEGRLLATMSLHAITAVYGKAGFGRGCCLSPGGCLARSATGSALPWR
jgi:hypothetical protein